MEKKVGFGIVGCGVIAPWHLKGIARTEEAQLVAVCDEVEEKARKMGEEEKVEWYTDYQKMLEMPDLNVVCLCTPSSLHSQGAVAAAQAGKHILTEKPIAISLSDADRMIEAAHKAGVKLGVIFQRRSQNIFLKVKRALEEGELGKIVLGDAYMKYYRSQQYYDSGAWRGTWEFDGGGALMNQGIHIIDLLQWYMGPVDTIYGYAETLARKIKVEDTSVAVLKFKSGALGVIEGTTSVYPETIPHRLELHGDRGSIMIEGEGIRRWEVRGEEGKVLSKLEKIEEAGKAITSPTDIGMEGHIKQIGDMVEAIKEDKEPLVNGEEGRKSLQIILAIYQSAKTGKPVKLI